MTAKLFSRRALLALFGGGAAALILEACSGSGTKPTPFVSLPPSTSIGATPTSEPTPAPTTPAASLEEKAGQMMLVGFDGQTAADAAEVTSLIQAGQLGALVLFANGPFNISSPDQVAALSSGLQALSSGPRPIIACDEEGGEVARLDGRHGFPATVSEQDMAEQGATSRFAGQMADALKAAGVNLDLAPVVDVNVNPDNPIIGSLGRSFSSDPQVVAQNALSFIAAMHERGVLCTLKHFPGHGSSTSDSHKGFVDVTNTWTDAELIPFQVVIDAGQADVIMTAHIFNAHLDPTYPATLSYATITGLLRGKMGYEGVVMTDSITMQAITDFYGFAQAIELAINAGADMISIAGGTVDGQHSADAIRGVIVDAVQGGRIPQSRIDESYVRIISLRNRLSF